MGESASSSSQRIDKWLWLARFFKTRALAAAAVRGGKVHIGGVRTKPAREIKVGEGVEITRGTERFEVVVQALGERRGPAAEAQRLYQETEAGRRKREALQASLAAAKASQPAYDHRPSKRERRQLERFRGRH